MWNGPQFGCSLVSLPLHSSVAENRLSGESGHSMLAHPPLCLFLGLGEEVLEPGEGSMKLRGMWQTVMSKSGPRAEAVQLPLKNIGGSRSVPTERDKLMRLGGRYELIPTYIMRCVGMCMPLDQWNKLEDLPCCEYIHMAGMRGSTLIVNSTVPVHEKEEYAA